jgi:hypothetical protein
VISSQWDCEILCYCRITCLFLTDNSGKWLISAALCVYLHTWSIGKEESLISFQELIP